MSYPIYIKVTKTGEEEYVIEITAAYQPLYYSVVFECIRFEKIRGDWREYLLKKGQYSTYRFRGNVDNSTHSFKVYGLRWATFESEEPPSPYVKRPFDFIYVNKTKTPAEEFRVESVYSYKFVPPDLSLETSEVINNVKITMSLFPGKETYTVGEMVEIKFKAENNNENYGLVKAKINYNDGELTKQIEIDVGGYGSSNEKTISATVHSKFRPCFTASIEAYTNRCAGDVPLITDVTLYMNELTKHQEGSLWPISTIGEYGCRGGIVVWRKGRQVKYPILPIRKGIERMVFKVDSGYTPYRFAVNPTVYLSNNCNIKEVEINYANHAGDINHARGGIYMTTTHVSAGLNNLISRKIDDNEYTPLMFDYTKENLVGTWNWVEGGGKPEYIGRQNQYEITLPNSYDAILVLVQSTPSAMLSVYYDNTLIERSNPSWQTGQFLRVFSGNFVKGKKLRIESENGSFVSVCIVASKFNWTLRPAHHRVYISNKRSSGNTYDITLDVFACPEEVVDIALEKMSVKYGAERVFIACTNG